VLVGPDERVGLRGRGEHVEELRCLSDGGRKGALRMIAGSMARRGRLAVPAEMDDPGHAICVPGSYNSQEPTGSWERGRIALVVLIWCVAGLLVSIRTFRWRSREDC
jgi:hypothetical protein